jgi:hypothetical protein
MEESNTILSPLAIKEHKPGDQWKTPVRSIVRGLRWKGLSYGEIRLETGLTRSTIQHMVKGPSSRTTRKGKTFKPRLLKQVDIKRIFRFVSLSWTNRTKSWARIKAELHLEASTTTIRRTMKRHGYRRCVACRRPFISKKAAAKRLAFALKYRWWSIADWKKVIWSDEATFETGKRGRIWVTRRPSEQNCQDCIQSIYRSGRVSIMVWGAIGWDWKSPLIFMVKEEGRKGVCSQAYLNQVLEPVIFPFWASLTDEQRQEWHFIEDGSKVHKGKARLPRLNHGVRGFNWPPSSPDLNPIEKVWRWMKDEINKLDTVPLTIENLKEVIQELWSEVDPKEWRYLTHRLTCKLEDVIDCKGIATIH